MSLPYFIDPDRFIVTDVDGIDCVDIGHDGDAFIWRSNHTFIMIPHDGSPAIHSSTTQAQLDADNAEWDGCE